MADRVALGIEFRLEELAVHAGLDRHQGVLVVDAGDPVHALHVDHHLSLERDGAAKDARTAAIGDDGKTGLGGEAHDLLDLVSRTRAQDDTRQGADQRPGAGPEIRIGQLVVGVPPAVVLSCQDVLRSDDIRKLREPRFTAHHDPPISTVAARSHAARHLSKRLFK